MEEQLQFAKQLSLQAGQIMFKYFKKGMSHRFKKDLSNERGIIIPCKVPRKFGRDTEPTSPQPLIKFSG